jgi:hypothetical protein
VDATRCEGAFDAAVSALAMADHLHEILALEPAVDLLDLLEGRIWEPGRCVRKAISP